MALVTIEATGFEAKAPVGSANGVKLGAIVGRRAEEEEEGVAAGKRVARLWTDDKMTLDAIVGCACVSKSVEGGKFRSCAPKRMLYHSKEAEDTSRNCRLAAWGCTSMIWYPLILSAAIEAE